MDNNKDNNTMVRRNRNNRARGGKFEKVGADYLDMDVVPYSGSNARFGYGDVRDSIWLGEFKNITPNDGKVIIKHEWLDKNMERASAINHIPFLAWMSYGKPTKFIIIDEPVMMMLKCNETFSMTIPKKSCNAKNIIININDSWNKQLKSDGGIVRMMFGDENWYMMRIELFKHLIYKNNLKGDRSTV